MGLAFCFYVVAGEYMDAADADYDDVAACRCVVAYQRFASVLNLDIAATGWKTHSL